MQLYEGIGLRADSLKTTEMINRIDPRRIVFFYVTVRTGKANILCKKNMSAYSYDNFSLWMFSLKNFFFQPWPVNMTLNVYLRKKAGKGWKEPNKPLALRMRRHFSPTMSCFSMLLKHTLHPDLLGKLVKQYF